MMFCKRGFHVGKYGDKLITIWSFFCCLFVCFVFTGYIVKCLFSGSKEVLNFGSNSYKGNKIIASILHLFSFTKIEKIYLM